MDVGVGVDSEGHQVTSGGPPIRPHTPSRLAGTSSTIHEAVHAAFAGGGGLAVAVVSRSADHSPSFDTGMSPSFLMSMRMSSAGRRVRSDGRARRSAGLASPV